MFQIQTMTEAHVASVTNRVEKHGDDDKPAVSLMLELTIANTALDLIDPKIRESLYKAVDDQEQLPGVEAATPVLRCNSFERHTLPTSYEGWTLAVDDGIDDTEPMVFGGVKADKFSFEAKQGGSVDLKFRVGTSDVDADKLGKLAMHNGQSIWITLKAPEKKPDAIDGTTAAFERDHPGAADGFGEGTGEGDATDLFAQTSAEGGAGGDPDSDEDEDSEGGATDLEERLDNALARSDAGASSQPVTVETSRPGTRTARGRDKTKAALAAGQAATQSDSALALAQASDAAQAHIAAVGAKLEGAES